MPRFFIDESNILGDENLIKIIGEDVNHIKNVLRLRIGDMIVLCDGKGTDYSVRINNYEKDSVTAIIEEQKKCSTEASLEVTLFQGLPKSDKMDFIIQKSVELGIRRLVPVINERTVVRLDDKKDIQKKTARWNRISLEAAKQCNRGIIPEVTAPISFNEAVELGKHMELAIIPYENELDKKLRSYMKRGIKNACLFIGPEGGFTEEEVKKAEHNGIKSVTLGPRILRTETAGIAALSIIMYELGDIGG